MVEVEEEYYFPEIIEDCVAKVNAHFSNRSEDPFSVHFKHGIYEQVGNDQMKATNNDLLIWLVMPFDEVSAKDDSYCSDVTCRLIIAIETDSNYTMQEREEQNIKPRLIPVYQRLKFELQNEPRLQSQFKLDHGKKLLPYWGGGDVAGPGQPNLWKKFADCYDINNLKVKKNNIDDQLPFTNIK